MTIGKFHASLKPYLHHREYPLGTAVVRVALGSYRSFECSMWESWTPNVLSFNLKSCKSPLSGSATVQAILV